MSLNNLSEQDWQEWQQSNATEVIKSALSSMLRRQEQAAKDAYMAGRPWPESERISLKRLIAWHEDFFEATLDDVKLAIEER